MVILFCSAVRGLEALDALDMTSVSVSGSLSGQGPVRRRSQAVLPKSTTGYSGAGGLVLEPEFAEKFELLQLAKKATKSKSRSRRSFRRTERRRRPFSDSL